MNTTLQAQLSAKIFQFLPLVSLSEDGQAPLTFAACNACERSQQLIKRLLIRKTSYGYQVMFVAECADWQTSLIIIQ
jgi:hypothetical protein